jgi:hypothetical protein
MNQRGEQKGKVRKTNKLMWEENYEIKNVV